MIYPDHINKFFVYELHYYNIPFYVGFSAYPEYRYKQHIYDPLSKCYGMIRFCIEYFDQYPGIIIVSTHQTKKIALTAEQKQINKRLREGIELLNFQEIKIDSFRLSKQICIPEGVFKHLK